MKKLALLALGCSLFVITSCSGLRGNAGFSGESFTNSRGETITRKEYGQPGIVFSGNKSELPPIIRADAESYAIKKDADTRAEYLKKGEVVKATGNDKILMVVNNSKNILLEFFDPKSPGMLLTARPNGGYAWAYVPGSMKEITFTMNGAKTPHRLHEVKKPYEIYGKVVNYYVYLE